MLLFIKKCYAFFYMAPGGGLGTVVVPEIGCAMYGVVGGTTGAC